MAYQKHLQIMVAVPLALAKQIDRLCDVTGENRSTITRDALRAYVPGQLRQQLSLLREPATVDETPPLGA